MAADMCYRCKGSDIITDCHSGDIICRGCGEVQAERVPDERAEWNCYDESEGKGNPSRVGGSLESAGARVWGSGAPTGGQKRKRRAGDSADVINKKTKSQSKLEHICGRLADLVRSLHMDERVSQVGLTIADKAQQAGALKGKDEATLVAAIMYISCKHCGIVTSLKEIAKWTKIEKKAIGGAIATITKAVPELNTVVGFTPEQVVESYGGKLQLPAYVRTAATEAVRRATDAMPTENFKPHVLAAAVVLLLCTTRIRAGGNASASRGDHPTVTMEQMLSATKLTAPVLKSAHAKLYAQRKVVVTEEFTQALRERNLEIDAPK